MENLPAHLCDSYACDFHLADDAFYSGRLEATSCSRQKYWNHWQKYASSVGVDPYLQDTHFSKHIQLLFGFAARVHTGYYGSGNQVKNCTVSSALTAIGQTIALACDSNPTKVVGSEYAFCPTSKSCWMDTRRLTLPHVRSYPSIPMSPSSWLKQRTNREQLNASGQRRT